MPIKVLISQSFKNQQIIIENKFYLFVYKRCKRQLHGHNDNTAHKKINYQKTVQKLDFLWHKIDSLKNRN